MMSPGDHEMRGSTAAEREKAPGVEICDSMVRVGALFRFAGT
jgi:hypothetical protein